jgi:hypothetical protein
MHPAQKALAIAIILEGVALFALSVVFMYYAFQTVANMKPDSPWKPRLDVTWKDAWQRYKATGGNPIAPRSEFTELGLWYRRRAIIWGIVIALCWLALPFVNHSALSSLYRESPWGG